MYTTTTVIGSAGDGNERNDQKRSTKMKAKVTTALEVIVLTFSLHTHSWNTGPFYSNKTTDQMR